MRKRLLSIVIIAGITLSGCSNPFYEEKMTDEEKQAAIEEEQREAAIEAGEISGDALNVDFDEEGNPITYDIAVYTADELQDETYYIKHGDEYYEIPFMDCTFNGYYDRVSYVLPERDSYPDGFSYRTIMYEKDRTELQIPTMYADDSIIYKSAYEVYDSIEWERFMDGGYTIGIGGITENTLGVLELDNMCCNLNAHNSLREDFECVSSSRNDDYVVLNLDSIDGVKMTIDNVTPSGFIKDLPVDKDLTVNIYKGTELYQKTMRADVRYFYNFENYWTRDITYSEDGYIILEVPKFFKSGYYKTGYSGMFRYINKNFNEVNDISEIKYNKAYFRKDEKGNCIFEKDEKGHYIYESSGVKADEDNQSDDDAANDTDNE